MRRSVIVFALLAFSLAVAAESVATQRPTYKGKRQLICKGARIPAGWLLVDDSRDATMCGGPNPAVVNAYNVWVIEDISAAPVGAVIQICSNQPLPTGWVLVDLYRDKEKCGHPNDLYSVNVKVIRRAG